MNTIEAWLDQHRQARHLSWTQLANALGVSNSGLRRIRTGEVVPRPMTREMLAFVLGLPLAEVNEQFGITEQPDPEALELWRFKLNTQEAAGRITCLLVMLPPRQLALLDDADVVALQRELTDYGTYRINQIIQLKDHPPRKEVANSG